MTAALAALALVLAADPAAAAGEPAPAGEEQPAELRPTVTELRPDVLIREFLYQGAFGRVTSVFCDRHSGEIYVVDGGQSTIGIFDARGAPLFAFSDEEHLAGPLRVQVDRTGRIYVLDEDRTRIKVFSYRGDYLSDVDVAAVAQRPVTVTAFAIDDDDNLYVGDAIRAEILILDHRRELRERFGSAGTGKGEFTSIAAIAVDADRIYVADQVGLGAQVFSRHGRFLFGFGVHEIGKKNVSLPAGIAVDPKGRFVLVDTLRHEIKYLESDGELIDVFGGIGAGPGDVAYPTDVSIGRDGVVCVADKGNHRVQVLKPVEGIPDRP